jgi:hypothetical protein
MRDGFKNLFLSSYVAINIYIYIYIYKRVIELSYGGKIYFVNESFMTKTYFFISSTFSEEN